MDPETKDARMWAMICHLCGLLIYIGIPLGNIIGPLVIWMIKKNDYPFVDDQGKEALNFQISMTIYGALSALLIFVLIGIPLVIAVGVLQVICTIIAAIKANDGVAYRYPLTIRFLK